jgi:N-acyl-D-aspartate/D-glutamate deacylase
MEALTKMTLMPAQRLERRVPAMKNKGRIRVGADADLTIFDARSIIDKSTFQDPAQYSEGIKFVVVNGTVIIKNGHLEPYLHAGRPVRAPF